MEHTAKKPFRLRKRHVVGAAIVVAGFLAIPHVSPAHKNPITLTPTPTATASATLTPDVSATPSAQPTVGITPVKESNGVCHARQVNAADPQAWLPDPTCTPGVTNPAVTQATIYQTICVSGYTGTIRPPVSYTSSLKTHQIAQYGWTDVAYNYEEDHFISLELGGSPIDPKNLWPEPGHSMNEKDTVENYLHKQVCSGALALTQAQKEITTNWYQVYERIK